MTDQTYEKRDGGPYVVLIVDGEVDYSQIQCLGKDEAWLKEQIEKIGVKSVKEIVYLGVNPEGEIGVDLESSVPNVIPPVI